jgi:protease PrsW
MKLAITVQNGYSAGRRLELSQGFLTVGRAATCNLTFDPNQENMVSSKHAYIEAKPDGFYLTDTQSTNGTFVNGERIQVRRLNSGDVIQFGKNGPEAGVMIEGQQPPVQSYQPAPSVPTQGGQQANWSPQGNQYAAESFGQSPPIRNSMSSIGLNAEVKPDNQQTKKYIGLAIAVVTAIFLSLIVICLMVFSVGVIPAVIASFVAFIPAFFYILPLLWLDRYDPEPPWLLAFAFAWGALVAVVFSFVVNTVLGGLFGSGFGAVISAPIFEEASKGVGLLLLLIFMRREFDDTLDGIIYAGTIALGFATVENVLYYGRGIATSGSDGLIVLFIMRGIMSPFAHVTFTAMTGIGCGIARESHNQFIKFAAPIVGYCCAVALHALWNGMAVIGGSKGFLYGYLLLEVPFFILFVIFILLIMLRQSFILKSSLALDIAQRVITEDQMKKTTSAFRSTFWMLQSLFSGKLIARYKFMRAVGKLGLSNWHIQRATAAQGQTGSFQQNPILREEVLKWRDKV